MRLHAGTTALERKILESQPLLEAFGNAQTGLNDNSSRFGKYIEVLFEGMDSVVGARVRKYLLEKSRVIKQNEGERNFHAFYYLADSAAGQALGLKGPQRRSTIAVSPLTDQVCLLFDLSRPPQRTSGCSIGIRSA